MPLRMRRSLMRKKRLCDVGRGRWRRFWRVPTACSRPRARSLPYGVVGRKPLTTAMVLRWSSPTGTVWWQNPRSRCTQPLRLLKDFWLIGELWVAGTKVAETRQWVSLIPAQSGPTVAFLKMMAPIPATSGELEFKVFKSDDGNAREDLFRNILPFQI